MLSEKTQMKFRNGRPSALNMKTHSRRLCQAMDRVYSSLELTDSIVKSSLVPVRRHL